MGATSKRGFSSFILCSNHYRILQGFDGLFCSDPRTDKVAAAIREAAASWYRREGQWPGPAVISCPTFVAKRKAIDSIE